MSSAIRWHYIVGDIHGCLDELLMLEAKATRHAARHGARPRFVSVGDLVDRGPNSAGVVARFREGAKAGTHAAILGNHEQSLLRALAEHAPALLAPHGGLPACAGESLASMHHRGSHPLARHLPWAEFRTYARLNWLGQGGGETLASWGADPWRPATWRIPDEDLAFLCGLPLLWENEAVVVTHALAHADELDLVRARERGAVVVTDATPRQVAAPVVPVGMDGADPGAWYEAVDGLLWRREVPDAPPDVLRLHVSGHTPRQRVRRLLGGRMLGIDTACAYGGRLTAWCVEAGRALSVPAAGDGWS